MNYQTLATLAMILYQQAVSRGGNDEDWVETSSLEVLANVDDYITMVEQALEANPDEPPAEDSNLQ